MCYKGTIIYLGLEMVNELEDDIKASIIIERRKNGLFKDTKDFIKRVPVSIEQMRLLVRVGAFNFTKKNKKELLWEIHTLISPIKERTQAMNYLKLCIRNGNYQT